MTAEELGKFLDELTKRLGPAGAHVWEIAIRWQITAGVVGLAAALIGLALTAWIVRLVWRRADDSSDYDAPLMRGLSTGVGLLVGSGLLVAVCDSALRLMNPEYSVIRDLIR